MYIPDTRYQIPSPPPIPHTRAHTHKRHLHTRGKFSLPCHLVQHPPDREVELGRQQRQPAAVRHADDGGLRAWLVVGGVWCVEVKGSVLLSIYNGLLSICNDRGIDRSIRMLIAFTTRTEGVRGAQDRVDGRLHRLGALPRVALYMC